MRSALAATLTTALAVSGAAALAPSPVAAGIYKTCETKPLSDRHASPMRLVSSADGAKAPGWKFDAGRLQTKYSSSLTCTRAFGADQAALNPDAYTYVVQITVAASQSGTGATYKLEDQTEPVWVALGGLDLKTECVWSTGRIVVREKASNDVTAVYRAKKLATGDC